MVDIREQRITVVGGAGKVGRHPRSRMVVLRCGGGSLVARWGSDRNMVTGAVGQYVASLLSGQGVGVRNETKHLRSTELPPGFTYVGIPGAPDRTAAVEAEAAAYT